MNTKELETISAIIPMYNEEKYIENFIDSILTQDYNFQKVELIFVDGNSKDRTVELLKDKLRKLNIKYNILQNDKKITPISLNLAIKNSINEVIIRLDVHSEYPDNYFEKCMYYINNIEADNVGCLIETKSEGMVGECIADVLSSSFGVGNSKFRINAKSGYVDTVPFGTFRRILFKKIGLFDERLVRSEDSEFNSRIIKNGGKIYLFNDIKVIYHPRDTIKKLINMAFLNGQENIYVSYLVPGSMRVRHFIPFLFVNSIIVGLIATIFDIAIIKQVFYLELILYLLLDIFFSVKGKKHILKVIICLILYPIFHISYGIGSILGVVKIIKNIKERRK